MAVDLSESTHAVVTDTVGSSLFLSCFCFKLVTVFLTVDQHCLLLFSLSLPCPWMGFWAMCEQACLILSLAILFLLEIEEVTPECGVTQPPGDLGYTFSFKLSCLSEMVITFALSGVGELILVLGYGICSVIHLDKLTWGCVTET